MTRVICGFFLIIGLVLSQAAVFAAATDQPSQKIDAAAEIATKIDINTAGIDALKTLPGVGEKTAEEILAYRKANGQFKTVEDLMNVKGIGEKKFDKIKPHVKV